MEQYAGLDVSLESTSICIVGGSGQIVRESKAASEPEVLIDWFRSHGTAMVRIGLEAGPLSQWLFAALKAAGLPVELIETRHVRAAFKAMTVKTDRNDARGIAHLMRMGWFRPVHCKSLPAQEVRALLTTRKLLQTKRHDIDMSLRGVLRGFGLKVGVTTPKTFEGRARDLVAGHPTLVVVVEALLSARAALEKEFKAIDRRLLAQSRSDVRVRSLMSVPGVGALVALTFVSATVAWQIWPPHSHGDGSVQPIARPQNESEALVRVDPRQGGGTASHDRMSKCVADGMRPQLRRTGSRGTATMRPCPPIPSNTLTDTAGGAGLSAYSSDPVVRRGCTPGSWPAKSRSSARDPHLRYDFRLGCRYGPKAARPSVTGRAGRPTD